MPVGHESSVRQFLKGEKNRRSVVKLGKGGDLQVYHKSSEGALVPWRKGSVILIATIDTLNRCRILRLSQLEL